MDVSVIIPTFQGADRIVTLLRALERQTFSLFEVIVVVDGSTDGTQLSLEKNKFSFNHFVVLDQANKGRAGARNEGAKIATGNILLFLDDDIMPYQDLIQRHLNFHAVNLNAFLMGDAIQYVTDTSTDFEKYRAHLSEVWVENFPMNAIRLNGENLFLMAANLSIAHSSFIALRGFDEMLSDAEDHELGIRAYKSGYLIFFDKSIKAWHIEHLTCRRYIHRQRQYSWANQRVMKLHADFFTKGGNGKSNVIVKPVYKLLSSPKFVQLIDDGFFVPVPRRIRYKFYSMVVFSLSVLNYDRKI